MNTLADALRNAGIALTPEEEAKEQEVREEKHRSKTVLERPKEEVHLQRVYTEDFVPKKYQKDPTDDLISVKVGVAENWRSTISQPFIVSEDSPVYFIYCADTRQAWIAPTKLCLDANFIYREDLDIYDCKSTEELDNAYDITVLNVNPGIRSRIKCYILDNPAAECYEVYYDSNYPSLKYGKANPNGMFIHLYENRFHRDMAIMELDKLYADSSKNKAALLTKKELKPDEAIIISDGCWMKGSCSSAFYYLDSTSLIKMAEGFLPTEEDQAVLISEIRGATDALTMCKVRGKKTITYYYDNTSIMNCLRNRKTEYIAEIREYKDLLQAMDNEGYQITFIELHPKTGEDNVDENTALMFFHNYCDKECREMSDIFCKDYKDIATSGNKEGKSLKQVREEFKPKGRPGQSSGKGYQNNSRNGNNRYGKRF